MLTRSPVPARSPSASPSSFHTSFHYAPASPQKRSPKPPTALSRRQSTTSPLGVNNKTRGAGPGTATATATATGTATGASHTQTQMQTQTPTRTAPPTAKAPSQPDRPTTTTTTSSSTDSNSIYIGVDAATQYSPMEPHDYFAPKPKPKPNTAPDTHTNAPSLPDSLQPAADAIPAALWTAPAASNADPEAAAVTTPTLAEEPPMLRAPHPLSPNKRRNSQGPGSVIGEDPSAAGAGAAGVAGQALPKRVKPETAPAKVLPVRYELCAIEDIVVLIANMLSELIETNDALAMRSGHLTRFHSRTAPGISVLDYLHRLAKHATLPPPLLLSMVYYIDRLCALYPDFTINTLTVHRFLITAATVAAKGLSDSFWNNSTYARVGGVRVAELKLLELEFLHRVDWKIVPDPDVLVAYYRGLVQRSPAYVLEDEEEPNGDEGAAVEDEEVDEEEETEISDEDGEDGSGSEASSLGKPPDAAARQ